MIRQNGNGCLHIRCLGPKVKMSDCRSEDPGSSPGGIAECFHRLNGRIPVLQTGDAGSNPTESSDIF